MNQGYRDQLVAAAWIGSKLPNEYIAVLDGILSLRRLAHRHHTACERYCNEEGFDPAQIERIESRLQKARWAIHPLINIISQRDPRGWTVRVEFAGRDMTHLLWA